MQYFCYGNGLAAVIGTKYGKYRFRNGKSVLGVATMFISSLIISLILLGIYQTPHFILYACAVTSVATILEYLTTKGYDNLTVPLGTSLFYYLLIMI
ncbi:MAG: hypothetical protein RBT45_01935 [Acholeplasmataceae bacterium]|jgi:dolichol kinase|nr:hypothetical protein [Acholeplasmataceae bacterium]